MKRALLLIAIGCLGYTGWIYLNEDLQQRQESNEFDQARRTKQVRPRDQWSARLTIPRLRLTTMVQEGVDEGTLRAMAGHIPGTAFPGWPGNVGVAAHRDTHFRSLRLIRKRDRIVVSTATADYQYEVISTRVVNPEDVTVLAPTRGQKTLTLVTCYPFNFIGNAPRRFIVRAKQIG